MKFKNNIKFSILCAVCVLSFTCCKNDAKEERIHQLEKKYDSLQTAYAQQEGLMSDMTSVINTISETMDSLAYQEGLLLGSTSGEAKRLNRKEFTNNLRNLSSMVSQQRERLAELEKSLKDKGEAAQKLTNMIQLMRQQLDEKEAMIASLQKTVNQKNVDISQLNTKVNELVESNHQFSQKIEQQVQTIADKEQTISELNNVYVTFGNKKMLKNWGIVEGGFLKKTKINFENLDKSKFTKWKKSEFDGLLFTDQKTAPKILTQMPKDSYTITKEEEGYRLNVTNKDLFWKVSKFLVIQLD